MQLKEYLEMRDIKPYVFAQEAGLSWPALYSALRGQTHLSRKYCEKIEKYTEGIVTKEEAMWPKEEHVQRKTERSKR